MTEIVEEVYRKTISGSCLETMCCTGLIEGKGSRRALPPRLPYPVPRRLGGGRAVGGARRSSTRGGYDDAGDGRRTHDTG